MTACRWDADAGAYLVDGTYPCPEYAFRSACPTAETLRAYLAARQRPTWQAAPDHDEAAAAALCSQCDELPAVMIKVGTEDGWCTDCLDRAAATPDAAIKALLWAADEMEAVIADGEVADVAAPVPGEVGRAALADRRDRLYEEPATWLREYAAALAPTAQATARPGRHMTAD